MGRTRRPKALTKRNTAKAPAPSRNRKFEASPLPKEWTPEAYEAAQLYEVHLRRQEGLVPLSELPRALQLEIENQLLAKFPYAAKIGDAVSTIVPASVVLARKLAGQLNVLALEGPARKENAPDSSEAMLADIANVQDWLRRLSTLVGVNDPQSGTLLGTFLGVAPKPSDSETTCQITGEELLQTLRAFDQVFRAAATFLGPLPHEFADGRQVAALKRGLQLAREYLLADNQFVGEKPRTEWVEIEILLNALETAMRTYAARFAGWVLERVERFSVALVPRLTLFADDTRRVVVELGGRATEYKVTESQGLALQNMVAKDGAVLLRDTKDKLVNVNVPVLRPWILTRKGKAKMKGGQAFYYLDAELKARAVIDGPKAT